MDTPQPKKVLVLCSGGMDSVTALYSTHARKTSYEIVGVLSFDYGSKHNANEGLCVAHHARVLGYVHDRIPLDFIKQRFASNLLRGQPQVPDGHYADQVMKLTVVPFRNGIMLAIAAGLAESLGAASVLIAAHAGDHAIYPDCRAEFLETMEAATRLGTYAQIDLAAPFVTWTKSEIVREGIKLGIDYASTWSCYKGGTHHCGRCGTCIERREAFYLAGMPDPTEYAPDAPRVDDLVQNGWRLKE